jgi:hypothetical protein
MIGRGDAGEAHAAAPGGSARRPASAYALSHAPPGQRPRAVARRPARRA